MATDLPLLPGESTIASSKDNALALTNLRVKYEVVARSKSVYKSIPIEKISACVLSTRTYPILLVLAALSVLAIFAAPEVEQRVGAGIVAVIFVLAYFATRKGQIEIFSSGPESIAVPTKGLSHAEVRKFLESVADQYEKSKIESRTALARAA